MVTFFITFLKKVLKCIYLMGVVKIGLKNLSILLPIKNHTWNTTVDQYTLTPQAIINGEFFASIQFFKMLGLLQMQVAQLCWLNVLL